MSAEFYRITQLNYRDTPNKWPLKVCVYECKTISIQTFSTGTRQNSKKHLTTND